MRRKLFLILLIVAFLGANVSLCYANSAEPPSILIIVSNAPEDLEISVGQENIIAHRRDKAIESYFTFYLNELKTAQYTFTVTTENTTFEVTIDKPLKSYNNIFTLDLKSQTMTQGKSLSRTFTRTSIRLALTLLIEAIVFYLFGFRKKRSWVVFLIVNVITQGIVFIGLNKTALPLDSYIILSLIFYEIAVLFVELIAFLILVNEHPRWRTGLYVIVANILSLVAGGFLITILPF